MATCDLANPDYQWSYCPNYPASIAFAALFGITTLLHIYQAALFRKPFAIVLIMGGLWEVMGYILKTVSIQNGTLEGIYTAQMMLILLAPLLINAFIYMLVGRMIHFFMDDDRVFGIRARKMGLLFVVFDFIAFVVQAAGGSLTASSDLTNKTNGLHIYTAGVALQLAFNVFFIAVVIRFQLMCSYLLRGPGLGEQGVALNSRSHPDSTGIPVAKDSTKSFGDAVWLLKLTYAILGLILIRNFYRLAEFAGGVGNAVMSTEWYAYVFDAVPMFLALAVLNWYHPGQKLQGPRCDFTEEDQERKAMKLAKKDATRKEAWVNTQETTAYDRV